MMLMSLVACGSDSTSSTTSASTDLGAGADTAPVADVAASQDAGAADAPTTDTALDAAMPDTSPPVDTGPQIVAEPHNFQATQPWFSCTDAPLPPEVMVVDAFVGADQYFGAENLRQIEVDADFPATGNWAQIGLEFKLECPKNGLCDHWDRTGSLELVVNPEDSDGEPTVVEVARHITPYRTGMCQYVDVTLLAPVLKGKQTLRSWIDTWVGPGHAQGEGWRVSARFVFYPGEADPPDQVLNVFARRGVTVGEIELDKNVDSQVEPFTFVAPPTVRGVIAHLTTTGHSFGNSLNCAEFCEMRHDIIINSTTYSVNPWRPDCAENPVSPQAGTWQYARNGWCPGAIAVGQQLDVTSAIVAGEENTIDFDILLKSGIEYDNVTPVDLLPTTQMSLKLYIFE